MKGGNRNRFGNIIMRGGLESGLESPNRAICPGNRVLPVKRSTNHCFLNYDSFLWIFDAQPTNQVWEPTSGDLSACVRLSKVVIF
jgi:hypothetical protein